jgi:hypothetical protein
VRKVGSLLQPGTAGQNHPGRNQAQTIVALQINLPYAIKTPRRSHTTEGFSFVSAQPLPDSSPRDQRQIHLEAKLIRTEIDAVADRAADDLDTAPQIRYSCLENKKANLFSE